MRPSAPGRPGKDRGEHTYASVSGGDDRRERVNRGYQH